MTTRKIFENSRYNLAESWGNGAYRIGEDLSYEELPLLAKAAVTSDPKNNEWKISIPDTPGLDLIVILCGENEG